jgi:hypothetical protein
LFDSLKNHGNIIFPSVSVAVNFFKLRGKRRMRMGRGAANGQRNGGAFGCYGESEMRTEF